MWCRWSYFGGFSTLSLDSWNICFDSQYISSSNGWWQCKDFLFSSLIMFCFYFFYDRMEMQRQFKPYPLFHGSTHSCNLSLEPDFWMWLWDHTQFLGWVCWIWNLYTNERPCEGSAYHWCRDHPQTPTWQPHTAPLHGICGTPTLYPNPLRGAYDTLKPTIQTIPSLVRICCPNPALAT